MLEELLRELETDRLGRLCWYVQRLFNIMPGSAPALRITDADYIFCAMHMLLDLHGRVSGAGDINPVFDSGRFQSLKEGGR